MYRPDIAVVMAAGEGTRWGEHLGVPKHLIEIDGETLLARTVRLLRERIPEVWVIAPEGDQRYTRHGGRTRFVRPKPVDVDKFMSSVDLWERRNALLVYGDCYFTDEAAATITGVEAPRWRIFCRPHASELTGCPYEEVFAYFFPGIDHGWVIDCCVRLAGAQILGRLWRSGGWELMHALKGWHMDDPRRWCDCHCVLIDDYTEDFDHPGDYELWRERRKA